MDNQSYLFIALKWTFHVLTWLAAAGVVWMWRGASCQAVTYATVAVALLGYGAFDMVALWALRRREARKTQWKHF